VQVAHDFAELSRGAPVILTIGAFDGVHRGHQHLIGEVVQRARDTGALSTVITFDPRPEVVLRPGNLQLTGGTVKERIIAALGPDIGVLLPFTPELAAIPAGDFLSMILDHLNLREIWVGADFVFGHRRGGTVAFLIEAGKHIGFAVHVIPRQPLDGVPISSSLIRELVAAGRVAEAARFLGHYFALEGLVVHGQGRGRALGFATANLRIASYQLLPDTGIYAGHLRVDNRRLPAAISVGYNPVFGGREIVVEAHVLDFDEDLYDKVVGLEFVDRVREERNFDGVDALIQEMHHDVATVRHILQVAVEPGERILSD
jgi:riboflavin kinase/FMN adenylyltransferase